MYNNDFAFYVPAYIDLSKSQGNIDERRIRGYASTPAKDRQDEAIVQKGLDISNFLNFGWFNYDHDNTKILGYPDASKTKIDSKGFYVEGTLLKGVPLADEIWELAIALEKNNAPRKLGFSVEGKVTQRGEDGKITKAKVYNVAITPNPVNPTATWEAMVKSFVDGAEPITSAGYTFDMGEENNGSSLKNESLESSLTNLASLVGDNDEAKKKLKELKEVLMKKSIPTNEAILYLQIAKGLSRDQAKTVVTKLNSL